MRATTFATSLPILLCDSRKLICLFAALLSCLSTAACSLHRAHHDRPPALQRVLTLHIVDESGHPFPGVIVSAEGPGLPTDGTQVMTDAHGDAVVTFPGPPASPSVGAQYIVSIEIAGYKTVQIRYPSHALQDNTLEHVKLEPTPPSVILPLG